MADEASAASRGINDSSAFAEHLRLIHLTLCLTCFIAIIAIVSQSASSASRAYDQTNILLKLRDGWRNGEWLNEQAVGFGMADARLEAPVEVQGETPETIIIRPARISSRFVDRIGWFTFAAKRADEFTALKPFLVENFSTVAGAEAVWNAMNEFRYAIKPSEFHDGWLVKLDGSVKSVKLNHGTAVAVSLSATQSGQHIRVARWILRGDVPDYLARQQPEAFRTAVGELVRLHKAASYLISVATLSEQALGGPQQGTWIFPADVKTESIDLERLLGGSSLPANFPPGDFKHAFPDTGELAKNLKTLSLSELQTFFQSEKDRTGDKIEFPLVKLPAESVAYWGTATIFFLAVYWFAVFRDFGLRLVPGDKAWATAWIGISNEFWSKGLFLVTTLLPPCAAAFIIGNGIDRPMPWAVRAALAAGAFAAVGVPISGILCCWTRIQRLEHSAPPVPPQIPLGVS